MKQFRTFDTFVDAEIAVGHLRAAGIDCEVRYRTPKQSWNLAVWIARDEDEAEAMRVLDEKPRGGPAWACPSCRSDNEGQFDACWSCGASRA